MLNFNIELIVFVLFLAINLAVGLVFSRRVNSLRDYAIGRKDFSTSTLAATIMVSWIGSWYVLEIVKYTYTNGLYAIIVMSGTAICLFFVGLLAGRMREFLNNLSVAEAMGDLYGKTVQIVTAISGVLSIVVSVAIEFKVISKVINLIFATEGFWVPIGAFAVVIIYSVVGGIRAITFTDIVQFFTFGAFMPILALAIWNQLKDPNQVIVLLNTHPRFDWSQVIGWHSKFINTLIMFLWFVIPAIDPVIFQRIGMARDIKQVKRAFTYASLLTLVVCLFLAWISILLLAKNAYLEPSKLFEYIIQNYTSVGLRSLIGIGVLALAMSTADSYLNASAVLLTNDIVKPLGIRFNNEVRLAKIFCVFSGIVALWVAIKFKGVLSLLEFANRLYMPVVTVPLLMAIFGFRSTPRAVLIGMGMGVGTVISWSLIFKGSVSILPGIVANLVGLLGSHYLLKQPGGWIGVREPQPLLEARNRRLDRWHRFKQGVTTFSLTRYLEKALPKQEYLLTIFGIYIIAATYASFYTVPEEVQKQYVRLYHIIGQSVLFISTGLLTYPLWPPIFKHKRFIIWAWPVSVCYVLFGVGTWLILLSDFHTFQTMIFLLNIVMAFLLFDFSLVIVMLFIGVVTAIYAFKIYAQVPNLPGYFDHLGFKILYGLLLLSSFVALSKYQQAQKQLISRNEYLDMLQAKHAENLQEALQHQERFMHTLTMDCVEGFKWLYERSKTLVEASKQVETSTQFKEVIGAGMELLSKQQRAGEYLVGSIYRSKAYMRLNVQSVKVVKLLADCLKSLDVQPLHPNPKIALEQRIANKPIKCDPAKIEKMLLTSLASIQGKNQQNKPITLIVQDADLIYEIPFISKYVKKIPAIHFILSTVETSLLRKRISEDIQSIHVFLPKHIEELPRTENEQIIDAHYGMASWEAKDGDITCMYVIPIDVHQIRPVIIDEL